MGRAESTRAEMVEPKQNGSRRMGRAESARAETVEPKRPIPGYLVTSSVGDRKRLPRSGGN